MQSTGLGEGLQGVLPSLSEEGLGVGAVSEEGPGKREQRGDRFEELRVEDGEGSGLLPSRLEAFLCFKHVPVSPLTVIISPMMLM